ncbi:MAG TPA: acyl-CoA dehydrogenase family protein [Chloroflexota bacterium]|nr:acyl-CoA dehydrogenase family protein [Chloroflexota bacterium]
MTKAVVPSLDFFRLDERLTAEEHAVRERVREFAESRVIAIAPAAWDAAELPTEIVDGLAELGIVGGTIQGYGCPGLSSAAYGLALQELARTDGSVATFMGVHSSLAMGAVYYCGTEEQRRRWLPDMAALRTLGAFALTEPEAGSDAASLQTSAVRDGDSYVINGRKRWIGLGASCDIAVIWARTEDGQINGFVVPRETPGYDARKIEGKISLRAIHQADIFLTNVRVPAENRLEGFPGFRGTTEVLMHSRFGIAWGALGHALACYDAALTYARSRVQFGRPLASFQLVQEKLVQMLNRISLMQLACLHLSALRDEGAMTTAIVSLVKMNNTAMARETARDARDILGGNGILNEYDVMRHLDDLEAVYTYEGTHDINMLIVGREITGISAFK